MLASWASSPGGRRQRVAMSCVERSGVPAGPSMDIVRGRRTAHRMILRETCRVDSMKTTRRPQSRPGAWRRGRAEPPDQPPEQVRRTASGPLAGLTALTTAVSWRAVPALMQGTAVRLSSTGRPSRCSTSSPRAHGAVVQPGIAGRLDHGRRAVYGRRIFRVPSTRANWSSPPRSSQARCLPPPYCPPQPARLRQPGCGRATRPAACCLRPF